MPNMKKRPEEVTRPDKNKLPSPENMKFVYVDTKDQLIEFDPQTGEGPVIPDAKIGRDLREASEACEDGPECGVVVGYLGGDGWWHHDHYLTKLERLGLGLTNYHGEK